MFDIINPKERREHKSNGNKQASRVEQWEEQASRSSGINGFPEDGPTCLMNGSAIEYFTP